MYKLLALRIENRAARVYSRLSTFVAIGFQVPHIFTSIKFWLIAFFIVRLFGITNPPLEKLHNWRQATGLMVARNFLEIDNNIFYPRKDDHEGAEGEGVVRMEFPLLNYGHYLVSKAFGHDHWYGRLLNLIVTTIGLFYFFKLLNMHFERRTAFYSTLILTVSIWFVFARKIMPDTFSTALVIIALYHAFNYWKFNKPYSVLWFALIGCLGVLAKIPSVILIASLGTVFFSKGIFTLKKTALLVGTALIAVASYGWYFVWNPSLGQQYAGWSNDNRSIAEGINDLLGHLSGLAEIFYFNAMQGFIFSIFIVVGLVYAFINKEGKILWTTAFITAVLFIYMFKAGYYFVQNNYYIIPFVPVLALISGYGITRLNKRWRMIILAFGMIEAVANQQHDFFIDDNVQYKMTIEEVLNSSINESADIAIFSNSQNHLLMYLAHRKGWMLFEQDAQNQTVLKDIKSKGCEYLVVDRHIHEDLQVVQDKVFENEDFRVYRL